MQQEIEHKWVVSLSEAKKIQNKLKERIKIQPLKKEVHTICGVDTAFDNNNNLSFTALVLVSYPEIEILEEMYVVDKIQLSYIPGFLSFREGPSIVKALNRLTTQPDILMFDGQGIAHPRNMGIATHIGILFNIPSIGCAKSKLYGNYNQVGKKKGDFSYLVSKDCNKIGVVLRTRDNVKPVFVSPGHLIDVKDSKKFVLGSAVKYKLPEPTRLADKLSKKAKKLLKG
jgi:deoxyribonuclease V